MNFPDILHIVPSISQKSDGVANFATELSNALINRDKMLKLELITLDWAPMKDAPNYARFFLLGFGARAIGRSPSMFKWLKNRLKEGGLTVVHNHGLWMMPNYYFGVGSSMSNVKSIASPHGTLSRWSLSRSRITKKIFWHLFQKSALKKTDCFHATSKEEYYDIRRMGFSQPVCIIPCGINFLPLVKKLPNRRKNLLFLARIHPKKGVENLLKAWSKLQDKFNDWDLNIVGPNEGGYSNSMKNLSKKLINKRVFFHGALEGDKKNQVYHDASIYVLPTFSENFGITVAEALSFGTPVLITDQTPWKNIEKVGAGLCIEVGLDPLVKGLDELMSRSQDELDKMGERGYFWVTQEFNWDKVSLCFSDTYKWLAGNGPRPPFVIID